MLPGDEVYFVVDTEQVPRAMAAFGHEETEGRPQPRVKCGNIACQNRESSVKSLVDHHTKGLVQGGMHQNVGL